MKTLKQTVLPVLAGLMFAAAPLFYSFEYLGYLYYLCFVIPIYLVLVAVLFLHRRNQALTVGVALVLVRRFQLAGYYRSEDFSGSLPQLVPLWEMVSLTYLAGTVLLLLVVLVNVTPKLKKYRPYLNPVWFLPGLVMLAGAAICCFKVSAWYMTDNQYPFIAVLLSSMINLFYVGTPIFDAIGVLLISLWLKLCAPDDIKPYEEMVGPLFTPEQLEEKRLELGLAKRKTTA